MYIYEKSQTPQPINKQCRICDCITMHICKNNKYYCNICYDYLFDATDYFPIIQYCYICCDQTLHKYYYKYYRCSICHYSEIYFKYKEYKRLVKTNIFTDTLLMSFYTLKLINAINNYYYNLFNQIYKLMDFELFETDTHVGIKYVNKNFNKTQSIICIGNILAHFLITYSCYYIYNNLVKNKNYRTIYQTNSK